MSAGRFSLIIAAVAVVAIVAVVVASGGRGGSGSAPARDAPAGEEATPAEPEEPAEAGARPGSGRVRSRLDLPENPDDIRGSDPYALTGTRNLRRGLAVLDRERRHVEGVFESLRVAPGRIDTVIVHPDDRRTNVQVRADFEIAFRSTHDFPTRPDFRERGLTARMIDVRAPSRLLRQVDAERRGSAQRDVDYLVISRDIIDGRVDVSAYMRIRTPRPRAFLKEPGAELRAIG